MTHELILFCILGGVAGGFINGLAGFGTALFALGWWLQVLPPVQAVALSVLLSAITGVQGVALVRRSIVWPRLLRFLLPAIIGVPVGLRLLSEIDAPTLKIVVAGFLIAYGGFFAFRRDLPRFDRRTPATDMLVGFGGGVLGGVAGLSGALPTMWCALRSWTKSESRAVLQPFNVAILALSAIGLAIDGIYDQFLLLVIAFTLPVTMLSAQLGIAAFKRLRDDQFRRLLIGLMLFAGLTLLLREMV